MVDFITPLLFTLIVGRGSGLGGDGNFIQLWSWPLPHTSNMASQQTPAVFRWVSSTAKLNVGWIEHISSHSLHGFCFSHERNGWTAAFSDTVICFSGRKRWVLGCSIKPRNQASLDSAHWRHQVFPMVADASAAYPTTSANLGQRMEPYETKLNWPGGLGVS